MMRTTITLDDDIAAKIEILRQEQSLSFKQAVNFLLRQGLEAQLQPLAPKRFTSKPRKLGLRAGIDPIKLNQLADELEAEAIREKLA